MAQMSEADFTKLLELLQAIANALEGIEKQLGALVHNDK